MKKILNFKLQSVFFVLLVNIYAFKHTHQKKKKKKYVIIRNFWIWGWGRFVPQTH